MLSSGGSAAVPQSTSIYGTCDVAFCNDRDLSNDLKTWLTRVMVNPNSAVFYVRGFQCGSYPSGEKKLFDITYKKKDPFDQLFQALNAHVINPNLDVIIVSASSVYDSAVLFIRR